MNGPAGLRMLPLSDNRATYVGTVAEVDQVLIRLREAGHLAAVTDPAPDGHGGVMVTVCLAPPAARQIHAGPGGRQPQMLKARVVNNPRRWSTRVIIATAVVLLAAVAVAAYLLVTWIAAHLAMVAAAGVVAGGLLLLAGSGGGRAACQTVVTVTHRHR